MSGLNITIKTITMKVYYKKC